MCDWISDMCSSDLSQYCFVFFFNDTATTEIYTLSLHDALPIWKLVVAKINVDENSKSAMKYQAMSIPTMIIFKNGQIVERIVGALPKSAILSKIRRYL